MEGVFVCVPLASAIAYEATNVTTTAVEGSQSSVNSTPYHKQSEKKTYHAENLIESPQADKSNDPTSSFTNTTTNTITNSRRNKCFAFKDKYKVVPGRSFGLLPTQLHAVFLSLHCDEFFCEPHPMAGKGVYDCVRLARVHDNIPTHQKVEVVRH